jgi:hypothetical protein
VFGTCVCTFHSNVHCEGPLVPLVPLVPLANVTITSCAEKKFCWIHGLAERAGETRVRYTGSFRQEPKRRIQKRKPTPRAFRLGSRGNAGTQRIVSILVHWRGVGSLQTANHPQDQKTRKRLSSRFTLIISSDEKNTFRLEEAESGLGVASRCSGFRPTQAEAGTA